MSGRLEEIPGEEAFPAYLESIIASFYERAGVVRLHDDTLGSVTVGGTVSPAGGNFEEPVTQATLKVVGAFHGLSRERSDARRYPAIHPLDSWSKYANFVNEPAAAYAKDILRRGSEVNQMMKVIGEEGTALDDFVIYLKSEFLDAAYLQQDAFDKVDAATPLERQRYVFAKVTEVLHATFSFADKDAARHFFLELTQLYKTWNPTEFESAEFKTLEAQITEKITRAGAA